MHDIGSNKKSLKVLLANPRGFCAGVIRAVDIVERALEIYGPPVYVRHEIVHNHHVVRDLVSRGAIFVDEVDKIPVGAITVFSAHGVSRMVENASEERKLDVIDATCPLVKKVHNEGRRYAGKGYDVVLIGHAGHAEVEGTRGQIDGTLHVIGSVDEVASLKVRDPGKVAYITQTTLSVSDTREIIAALTGRFPDIVGPDTRDICYATQNRQMAVLELARHAQLILVVGSQNSSNSNRLCEIGRNAGVESHLLQSPDMIEESWLDGVTTLGLSAGASAPETLVQQTIEALCAFRNIKVESLKTIDENVKFRLPKRLEHEPELTLTAMNL